MWALVVHNCIPTAPPLNLLYPDPEPKAQYRLRSHFTCNDVSGQRELALHRHISAKYLYSGRHINIYHFELPCAALLSGLYETSLCLSEVNDIPNGIEILNEWMSIRG